MKKPTPNSLRAKTPIKEMMTLARKMTGVISLGQGMPSVKCPKYIIEEIHQIIDENSFNKYSDLTGLSELKIEVARHILEKYPNQVIDPEKNILITCGAMEATMTALLSIIEPGDEVIIFSPHYPSHSQQVSLAGGMPIFVELDEERNWALDGEKVKKAITERTKAIIVCNPSNPTGTIFSKKDIQEIINICKENNLYIINDETYNFLVFNKGKFSSPLNFPRETDGKLISCFSFSKEFAMTGLRVGYMLASEDIVASASGIHDALTICAPTLSQKIAIVMLKNKEKWREEYFSGFMRKRDLMTKALDSIGKAHIEYICPEGAYYILIKYKLNMPSEELALRLLNEAKVVTIPGIGFGRIGENHLRLSFAGDDEGIKEGVERIKKWFEDFRISI